MSFEEELNKRFEEESNAIVEMEDYGLEIFGHKLNDQQRITILELKKRDFFLNYSDDEVWMSNIAGEAVILTGRAYDSDAKTPLKQGEEFLLLPWDAVVLEYSDNNE